MTTDEIPDSVTSDALTAEEAAAFEEMRSDSGPPAKPEPRAEPEVEKPAATEPKTATKPEDKDPEVQKLVPHGAFEEERQRRKEAQRERDAERQERARLQGQLEALLAGKQPENLTPQEKIDWDNNPIAAGKALQAKLDQQEADAKKAEEQRQENARLGGIAQRHIDRFVKTQPHYLDTKNDKGETVQGAYTFLRIKSAEKIQERFPTATVEQVVDALDAMERQHIQECMASGDNAAERFWELALEAGYKAPEAPKPRADNGQFKPAEKSEAERIADLEKAQRGSRSLGSAPSGGGEPEIGMEALASMDDAEFAAATSGGNWEKLHRRGVI